MFTRMLQMLITSHHVAYFYVRSDQEEHSSLDDLRFSIFKFYLHFHIPRCVLLLNKEFLTSFQRSFSVSSCPISFGHGVRKLVA